MRIFTVILLIITANLTWATSIDSLKKVLEQTKGNEKFSVLLDLAWHDSLSVTERKEYAISAYELAQKLNINKQKFEILKIIGTLALSTGNLQEAKQYSAELALLGEEFNDPQTIGVAYNTIGFIFQKTTQYDSAIINYQKAIDKFIIAKSTQNAAQAMVNVGIIYKNIGLYKDAVEVTVQAVQIIEKENDSSSLASAYNNIGIALKELKNFSEAEFYLKRALKIRSAQKDTEAEAGVLNNLGNVYRNWGKYDEALVYYNRSLGLKEQLGNKVHLATTLDNIGEVYINTKNSKLAEPFLKRALQLRIEANHLPGITTSSNRLANFFLEKLEIDSALFWASKALSYSLDIKSLRDRLESYRLLRLIHNKRGDFKNALFYAEKYINLDDSLYSEEMAQTIANIEVKYRTEQYIKDLALSKEKEFAQQVQIKNQLLLIIILILAVVSISALMLLVYRSFKARKKAEEVEKMLRKEIQHRVKNNLQLISNMQRLQMGQTTNAEIKKVLLENENRIQAINLVHQSLYRGGAKNDLDFRMFVADLIINLKESYSWLNTLITEEIDMPHYLLPTQIANSLGLIVNELLTNAFKYSFDKFDTAVITITLSKKNNNFVFTLAHTNQLWDYSSLRKKEGSFGLTLMEILVEQLDGTLETIANTGETRYSIQFPSTKE
jgi:two-component system, sensor histidine kinase PdtaS